MSVKREDDLPELSNIREYLGWVIGHRVVDVTTGDPPEVPDGVDGGDDVHHVIFHLENGGMVEIPIGDEGFAYVNPDAPADDDDEDDQDDDGEDVVDD